MKPNGRRELLYCMVPALVGGVVGGVVGWQEGVKRAAEMVQAETFVEWIAAAVLVEHQLPQFLPYFYAVAYAALGVVLGGLPYPLWLIVRTRAVVQRTEEATREKLRQALEDREPR